MDKLNIGFVGVGNHARKVHYPSLLEMKDINLVAMCCRTREKVESAARRYGVPSAYTNFKEMLDKERLDAVYVITQPEDLTSIVLHCLSEGKNVFMEKPPGISLEETKKMAEAVERNHCLTMVGFNRRFMPVIAETMKNIASRKTSVNLCVGEFYRGRMNEARDRLLAENTIHAVDTLRSLGGEVGRVTSSLELVEGNRGYIFRVLLWFENNARGVLIADYVSARKVERYEINGKDFYAVMDAPKEAKIYLKEEAKPLVLNGEKLAGTRERHRLEGFYQESRHFIECIRNDKQPETSLQDSVKTMELVETILRS